MSFNISSIVSNPMHKKCFYDIRPGVLSPRSSSPVISHDNNISVTCEKRHFSQAFTDENEEERYGQKITNTFFHTNTGHCVIMVQEEEKLKEQERKSENDFQNSTDNLDENFSMDLGLDIDLDNKFKYKKSEEIDVQEIIQWCEFYRKNRNLFNV